MNKMLLPFIKNLKTIYGHRNLFGVSYHKKFIKMTKCEVVQAEIPLNLKNYENNLC